MGRPRALLSLALVVALVVPSTAASDAGGRGGTLVVAISADPGHLNPAITTSGSCGSRGGWRCSRASPSRWPCSA
jgi:hypothetical protein